MKLIIKATVSMQVEYEEDNFVWPVGVNITDEEEKKAFLVKYAATIPNDKFINFEPAVLDLVSTKLEE